MVTPKFIALWFVFSSFVFLVLKIGYGRNEIPRDWNAFQVLVAQGLGAAIAYAIH